MSDYIFDTLASLVSHKPKDGENNKSSKDTSSAVNEWNKHGVPETKKNYSLLLTKREELYYKIGKMKPKWENETAVKSLKLSTLFSHYNFISSLNVLAK